MDEDREVKNRRSVILETCSNCIHMHDENSDGTSGYRIICNIDGVIIWPIDLMTCDDFERKSV